MPESTQILSYNGEYTLSSSLFSNIDSDKIIKSGKLYVKLTDYIGIVSANRLKLYFKNSSNVYSIVDASNYFEKNNETIHLQSPLLKRVDYFTSAKTLPFVPPTYIYSRSTHISYDSKGNITSIKDGTQTTPTSSSGVNYEYDVNNRLTREDNYELNETIRYNYDDNGNITSVTHSDLNSSVVNSTDTYSYNNKYKDILVSFNSQSIAYSDYLNPTSFGTKSFTWVGERWLSSITDSSNSLDVRYTYNSKGNRTKKQFYITLAGNAILNRTVNLYLDGNRVIRESSSGLAYGGQTYTLTFLYSQEGVVGFIKDGDFYRYEKNILGDIVAIYQGISLIAKYIYDAYGNHKVYNGSNQEITYASNPNEIGIINPFRYRGYYYDSESGLYYCNSRYYSPELRRWLNIDDISYLDPENIDGINLFAYCLNNPVMNVDPDGKSAAAIVALLIAAFTIAGGMAFQYCISTNAYFIFLIASIWDEDIRNDMERIHWNPFNSDENLVTNSSKVSFYKGIPVIRTNIGRSGTFGIMFLQTKGDYDNYTVRHEYGHVFQQLMLGPAGYFLSVFIPSALEMSVRGDYYKRPWETIASVLGGDPTGGYDESDYINSVWHLISAMFLGPISLIFGLW